jgi:hypothetical protein
MMATFTSVSAFADHVAGYGEKIKGAETRALNAAALAATNDIRDQAKRYHITGRSGRKAQLKAGYTVFGSRAEITARPPGAWQLIEQGAHPHTIRPRKKGRGKRRALAVSGYGVFAVVHHPGTGGPIGHPWAIGVAKAQVSAPKAFADEIKQVFG